MGQFAAAVMRAFALGLWGAVLLQSSLSGRLDLLLSGVFHPLVALSGVALLLLAGLLLAEPALRGQESPAPSRRQAIPKTWWLSAAVALLVLAIPPNPSFSTLAANRPAELGDETELSFVLPPAQRSLTDWVRLLRSQPDPSLYAGDPVRISGFVLPQPGEPPQLARLLVRCCLADATPVGLPVRWPAGRMPRADQWLAVEGTMAIEERNGQSRSVVVAQRITPIARPKRPLEP
ncbi:TIGR03943 family protein [Cyanobium sp. Maggiore-St4-Cus]|uniref:TIGR03943 family putative permease subunit n=1 Tax=Cyanobium sp. Maggiore-St4-Cus TaxID=2823717 RepID=UPI0020CBB9B6|nr:TIGR03943 family protein [Cyanobium sp. Maggiore-St4-Cus]MCP9788589.1 TIGR03943 family protein [Cyanobium sp. Maggiore-St4-Cus]